jgi:hypothetical protein
MRSERKFGGYIVGQVISDINKNSREIIRIEVSEFKGRELINLRIWYQHFDGEYKPTPKGITLDISHYDELKNAVDQIGQYIKDKKKGTIPNINQKIDDVEIEEVEDNSDDVNEED